MRSFVSDLWLFLLSALTNWLAYFGGLVAVAIGLLERLTKWKLSLRAYVGLFIGGFLLTAFFTAWRDQRFANQELANQLELSESIRKTTIPNLIGRIKFLGTGRWMDDKEDKDGGTFVVVYATIANSGTPSIVNDLSVALKVERKTDPHELWINASPSEDFYNVKVLKEGKGKEYLTPQLWRQALLQPIPTGGQIAGGDVFIFPKLRCPDCGKCTSCEGKLTNVKLTFTDITGRQYEVSEVEQTLDDKSLPILVGSEVIREADKPKPKGTN